MTTKMEIEPKSSFDGIEALLIAAADDVTARQTAIKQEETATSVQASTTATAKEKSSKPGRTLRTWDESFNALVKFKRAHGHCNVPVRYEDSALANWVRYQQRNQESLTQERHEKLKFVGFKFGYRNDRQWDAKFERYKELVKQLKGKPLRVQDAELSQWIATQRSLYKKSLLREDRLMRLESINFKWQVNKSREDGGKQNGKRPSSPKWSNQKRDGQWLANYEKLKQFHKEHGHFSIPNQYEKDRQLGIWVSNQRSIYHRGQLSQWRKSKLIELGFVWRVDAIEARAEMYQKQWDQQLANLSQFKERFGHVDVPSTFEAGTLAAWVGVQKEAGRRGILDPQRAKRLLSLGFAWGEDRDTCWKKFYMTLQSSLAGKENGSLVTLDAICAEDATGKLGNWLKLQEVLKEHNLLSIKRVYLLETIGWKWGEGKAKVARQESSKLVGPGKVTLGANVPDCLPPLGASKKRSTEFITEDSNPLPPPPKKAKRSNVQAPGVSEAGESHLETSPSIVSI